jgi:Icc-related predicted phosphoesterase
MTEPSGRVRIGALGDLHYTRSMEPPVRDVLVQAGRECDVLLLCGDLTDHGLVEEAQDLAREIHSAVSVPVIAVLGNHDFEGGKQEEIKKILCDGGIRVLDGEATEVKGVGFAGVKGFCGGFGKRALGPWVLHYSPIQETVEGEPVEIVPFLGSSRLEEPLTRYPVDAVFHGHAHRGQPEGKTAQGIPVFNVSLSLLRQTYPDGPAVRVFEVQVDPPG